MTVRLLGPNGSSGVNLVNPNNIEKIVDAGDIASDSFVKSRVGSAGVLGFRNKIVDGRFDYWLEYNGTGSTGSGFGSDTMWHNDHSGTTKVHSQQLLSLGIDLPSIEVPTAKYFSRTVVTSVAGANNYCRKYQSVENVRTLAGKTATLSFYAKADTVRNIGVEAEQLFGSGGSTLVTGIGAQLISIGTSWKRYSVQIAIPAISGKTIGTGGDDRLVICFWFDGGSTVAAPYGLSTLGQQSGTFDLACVQLEEGSVATPFEELPIEVSQQRVNRYYYSRLVFLGGHNSTSSSYVYGQMLLPTPLRVYPAITYYDISGSPAAGRISYDVTTSTTTIATGNFNIETSPSGLVQLLSLDAILATTFNNWVRATITLDARL